MQVSALQKRKTESVDRCRQVPLPIAQLGNTKLQTTTNTLNYIKSSFSVKQELRPCQLYKLYNYT